jgi:hypothetical protein
MALKASVAGSVDFAHAPDAEQADDLVDAETGARREGHTAVSELYAVGADRKLQGRSAPLGCR